MKAQEFVQARYAAGIYRYNYWATVEQKAKIDAAIAKITNNED